MHKRVIFNLGSSNPVSVQYLFLVTMREKGRKTKKALIFKAFRGYIFFIALFWVRRWDFSLPTRKYSRIAPIWLRYSLFSPLSHSLFRPPGAVALQAHSLLRRSWKDKAHRSKKENHPDGWFSFCVVSP